MKSFETSGMFVQEMILVAFFLLILVEIRLLCIQHSRKRKVEVMAVNFLLLSVTYGILTDLLSDYLAIWEGKNKLLHIADRWPAGILFFLIFADTGYLICRIRREDEKYKKELSVYSIKQTLDHLKCGICFCDGIGQIVLCNEKMYQLGYMLTGENLQSYLLLKEALEAKQYSNGISKVGKKKNLYYFPNGTVWDFRQEKLEDPSLQGYIQVLALDVTNLYFNSEKIQKSNEELIRLNKEIRKMYECIDDQIREEETLAMKIRIHDSFGRSLLAVRQLLEEEAEPEKMKGQLKTIRPGVDVQVGTMDRQAIDLLQQNAGARSTGATQAALFLVDHLLTSELLLLGFLDHDVLIRVTNTLALVGFGSAVCANFSSRLTNLLLVGTLDDDFRLARRFNLDASCI